MLAVVHSRPEVHGSREGIVDVPAGDDPDVLAAQRAEAKTTSRPSFRTLGWMSPDVLLSSVTACAGLKFQPEPRSLT